MGIALARTDLHGHCSPQQPAVFANPSQDVVGSGNAPCEGSETSTCAPASGAFAPAQWGITDIHGKSWTPVSLPDGRPYPGDLVSDILKYRTLRARALSGVGFGPRRRARFERLEELMRSHDDPFQPPRRHVRAYHRFDYRFSAKVRFDHERDGTTNIEDAEVENISAGGVKLAAAPEVEVGQKAWLIIEHGKTTVTMPSRVAWKRDGAAGLMFAGAPSWA